ncbi:probable potassium transporter 17 [Carica papaya]|uniref:probable potassium transporter 17 n=1 Tax=Carica papaya TaxID=3649 RepID=UPI000B8CA21F|nr:probable potassium transporter 17 [Carica papaya]
MTRTTIDSDHVRDSPAALSEVVLHSAAPDRNRLRAVPAPALQNKKYIKWETILLAYKTIGVVMGSLVTSPLYVYPSMPLSSPTEADFLGTYSIIFWTLTLIGVVKYVSITLNAHDQGEGGTFALYSLLCRHMDIGILSPKRGISNNSSSPDSLCTTQNKSKLVKFLEGSLLARRVLLFAAILGMCMLVGDSILTPAMSVLSAIEGLRAPFPQVTGDAVKGISAAVLAALFLLQRFGTSRVSFLFSPIMVLWTLCIPLIGIYRIIHHYPSIFKAMSPHYAFLLFARRKKQGWLLLGGTILCITGSEAMFADLGHFDKASIQLAFLCTQYPSLILTYAGQTAYLIKNPNDLGDAFYKFVPKPVYWPMFAVATLAAIVASQSLISATFSVIKQSVVLDYFPRVKVVHTSDRKEGEVYSPEVNYILMILCVFVVVAFGDGKAIGNAYGVVVSMVMLITTVLLTLVMITVWKTHHVLIVLYFCVFFTLESCYVSAILSKLLKGGWIPFVVSLVLAFIMFGWFYGRQRKMDYELTHNIDLGRLEMFLSDPSVHRVPGVCFFYTSIQDGFTPVLAHYVRNMKSLHKITIFTTFRYLLVPKVPRHERIIVKKLALKGLYRCIIQYGYADSLNLEEYDLVSQVIDSMKLHLESLFSNYPLEIQEDFSDLEESKLSDIVHVRGKTRFYVGKKGSWFDRIVLAFYEALHNNCRSALPALNTPQQIEIGMVYEV